MVNTCQRLARTGKRYASGSSYLSFYRGGGRKTSNRSAENVAAGSSARADSIKKDVAFPHNFDILRSEGSSACGEETRLEGGQMSLSFHTTTGNTVYFTARSNGGLGENEPTDTATVPETRLQVPEDYRSSEAEGGPLVAQRIHLVTPSCVAQPRPSSMLLEVKWPVKKGVELATHFLGGPSTGRGRAPVGSIGVKPGQMLNRCMGQMIGELLCDFSTSVGMSWKRKRGQMSPLDFLPFIKCPQRR